MIRYALICPDRHEFESWFASSAAYDEQARRALVTCPVCGSEKIAKALMTPRLVRTDARTPPPTPSATTPAPPDSGAAPTPATAAEASATGPETGGRTGTAHSPAAMPALMVAPQEQEFRRKLKELRDHLVRHAENVGTQFPEEARKIHYGDVEPRSIYGVASPEEAKDLHDEGIAFAPLPVLPDDRN
jgi:hypothetical protein